MPFDPSKYGKPVEDGAAAWDPDKYGKPTDDLSFWDKIRQSPITKSVGKVITPELGRDVMMGLRSAPDALAQLATRGVEAVMPAGSSAEAWAKGQRENVEGINRGAAEDYKRQGGDLSKFSAGRLMGEIPAEIAVGLAIPGATAARLLPRIGAAMVGGGASGAMQPVDTQANPDYWKEKGKQIGYGAGVGGVAGTVLGGLGQVIAPRNAQHAAQTQTLMDEGVRPTIGQTAGGMANRMEEKAMSLPVVGDAIRVARERALLDFNRAAINRALEPIGQRIEATGREGIGEMIDRASSAYRDVLPRISLQADQQLGQEVVRLQRGVRMLPPDMQHVFNARLQESVANRFNANTARMSGETFKQLDEELGAQVRNYMTGGPTERQLGDAFRELQASLRRAVERSNPTEAPALQAADHAYAMLLRVQKAAGGAGAAEGVFTPRQFGAAVRGMDPSRNKRQFARGNALMQDLSDAGIAVLGDKVPNSGTADRLFGAGALGLVSPTALGATAAGAAIYSPQVQELLRRFALSQGGGLGALGAGAGALGSQFLVPQGP